MSNRAPDIGLRQAKRLCQMPHKERLHFLSEGLPIICASSRSFRRASISLSESSREADVLAGHADEEAAKILILIDAVRCPPHLLPAKMGKIVRRFYDHQARLIYAKSIDWRPADLVELRKCVDRDRRSHSLEGYVGEYILPNWEIYQREARLYADIEASEDGELRWNQPAGRSLSRFRSSSLDELLDAMEKLGLFSPEGLTIISDVWGAVTFSGAQTYSDAERLTREVVRRVVAAGLPEPNAEQRHVSSLHQCWQLPMYDLDFSAIPVSLDTLKEEQDRLMWAEAGY